MMSSKLEFLKKRLKSLEKKQLVRELLQRREREALLILGEDVVSRLLTVKNLFKPDESEKLYPTHYTSFPRLVKILFEYGGVRKFSPPLPLPPKPTVVVKWCASPFHEGDRRYMYLDDSTITYMCDIIELPRKHKILYLTTCPRCCLRYGVYPIHIYFLDLVHRGILLPIAPEAKEFILNLLELISEHSAVFGTYPFLQEVKKVISSVATSI